MKKAIILDVDGVIIGVKKGVNTPHPHPDVMAKLKEVRESGVPIVLCTAKPAFGIEYEIVNANLDNPHIADGGALLVDNKGIVSKSYPIENNLSAEIISYMLENGVYVEAYTADDYYIDKTQKGDWTDKHTFVLQREPQIVDSLIQFVQENVITKIMIIVASESEKPKGIEHLNNFGDRINTYWAIHPPVLPLQFGVITASGVSKKQATLDISKILDVPLENMLAVGDSTSDWKYISECGYAGAMGNASAELKDFVATKGEENYIIGGDVDDNGIIGILDWYMGK